MKPILWVDAQILKFFTKIAKDFNWLTGKDNFFLAKIFAVLGGIFFMAYGVFKDSILEVLLGVFGGSIFALFLTPLLERNRTKEQVLGIKCRFSLIGDLVARFYWLFFSLLNSYRGLYLVGVSFFCLFCWAAFVGIDRPPFKKSQAWPKVKSWMGSFSARPQLQPIPVEVESN